MTKLKLNEFFSVKFISLPAQFGDFTLAEFVIDGDTANQPLTVLLILIRKKFSLVRLKRLLTSSTCLDLPLRRAETRAVEFMNVQRSQHYILPIREEFKGKSLTSWEDLFCEY